MRIALFGGTGMIGSRILSEARARGHVVTAVVRERSQPPAGADAAVTGDATRTADVTAAVAGHDAVVSAVGGLPADGAAIVVAAARALLVGVRSAGVNRLIVVGGAGSLATPEGVRLMDRPAFPEGWKAAASAQTEALSIYRDSSPDVSWTYISPADEIAPGERTGAFVLGGEEAVFDDAGHSRISAEDFAVALINELERPEHIRQRFTLGYA